MENENADFQIVPADIHRQNEAERVIGTWGNHFLVALSSIDDEFTNNLWYQLLYQAEQTLNILQP